MSRARGTGGSDISGSGGAGEVTGIVAVARDAGGSGRLRGGRVGAVIRKGVIKLSVWRGKRENPWLNGCFAPCIVKTKAKLLALRAVGTSPGNAYNICNKCSRHGLTGASLTMVDQRRRALKVNYKTYHCGEVTRFTNYPEETEDKGEGNDGDDQCGLPHAGYLDVDCTDGQKLANGNGSSAPW